MPKIKGFYELYDNKLANLIGKNIKLVEIGVQDGSSIQNWRKMSPSWDVWGVDIDPSCTGHQIIIGRQEDKEVLKQFEGFNVVIDDGGHTWKQQIETFEYLFPTMPSGSIYVIEDLHTSFWKTFDDYPVSTVDYLLKLVPHLNYCEANNLDRMLNTTMLTNNKIKSIEFYPSVVFITKE